MRSISYLIGLTATLLASQCTAQTSTTAALGAIQTLGCYSNAGNMTQDNTNTFQTDGLCQTACGTKNFPVMAIIGGSTCYCGEILPALTYEVESSKCNSPCQGFGSKDCGGLGFYQLYLTGLTGNVQTAPNVTSSAGSSGTSPTATRAASTVIVTASSTSTSTAQSTQKSGGANTVGIAVGVVIGIIVIAVLVGGVFFYMRAKNRKDLEKQHAAQAATIKSFVGSTSKGSETTSDTRLDPSLANFRRDSIGSIADERDYSRRVLQVRNPDGFAHRDSVKSLA